MSPQPGAARTGLPQLEELLDIAEAHWKTALASIGPHAYDRPSGCPGWSVRDLVNHVNGGGHRYAMLLDGASAADTSLTRGQDYIGNDAPATFQTFQALMRQTAFAATLSALVDHRAGPRSGTHLLIMRIMDLTLHTKDLCDGLGLKWHPPAAIVDFLLSEAAPIIDELRAQGHFGPLVSSPSTKPWDRLLALAGRSPEP